MRESVNKLIQGATDLLRLLRYKDANFDRLTVFALPKCGVQRCAVKITVTWKDMHFNYELKLLTAVDYLWSEIVLSKAKQRFQAYPKKISTVISLYPFLVVI